MLRMSEHYPFPALAGFLEALFRAEGLSAEKARVVARGFLEADLLGYPTHGTTRVASNLRWLRTGVTEAYGDPEVLIDRPALASWDAHRLPGPWAMYRATSRAIRGASECGTFTLTLRRSQHVACLAAGLVPVVEAGLIGLAMASSPEESFVSAFGGSRRLFSNNPLAFTAPASGGPILFDISMAITAGGQVARAARQDRMLAEAAIRTTDGGTSADPAALAAGGAIMPLGGAGHGHKGHALTIMTEVLTQALGGHGRAATSGSSEENSVFLLVMDPEAFGERRDYEREVNHLVAMIESSPPDDPERPVRVPGRRAWRERARLLHEGMVTLDAGVVSDLAPFARDAGLVLPSPLDEEPGAGR
jgi:L-lactate dehydrogenase